MASSAAAASPPVLSRLDRLDTMVGRLEELKGHRTAFRSSATSSGTLTTDTGSVTSLPKSFVERDRWCRSIDDAVLEVKLKGTIIDRIYYLETRILKQLEEEMEGVKRREEEDDRSPKRHSPGKGLKRLVKSCVKGHLNTKQ